MGNRINIWTLVRDHFKSLYDFGLWKMEKKKKMPSSDKVIFFFFPLFFAILFLLLGLKINSEFLNVLISCLSIFAGLLFGMLPLILDMINKLKIEVQKRKKKEQDYNITEIKETLSKELFANISFSVLLALFAIVLCLLTQIHPVSVISKINNWKYYGILRDWLLNTINFFAISILILFLLTLMMILKRFYLLFVQDNE